MKKNLSLFAIVITCTLLLAISLLFIFTEPGKNADAVSLPSDIADSFASKEITYLVTAGVLNTEKSGTETVFIPQKEVTREYFTRALIKIIGIDVSKYSSYEADIEDKNDISEGYEPYINAALANGLIGTFKTESGNYFLPQATITREEAAEILGSLSNAIISTTKPDNFSDIDEADGLYIENLEKLIDLDILIGYPDGTVKPKNILTREELAAIIYRILYCDSFSS
ncbi:MAG: S-layer homology domain-containing protein [Eubacteriales bacterium]